MPDEVLVTLQPVRLSTSLDRILSRPRLRVNCDGCGEEIINEREIRRGEQILCQACAQGGYYQLL